MSVVLFRCDDRLIHGQCIVRIINDGKINKIILVDDYTASNPIMVNIYKMSVPPTTEIELVSVKDAPSVIDAVKTDEKVLVLMKSPCVGLELQKTCNNIPKELNIGPMSNRLETKKLTFYSYLLEEEINSCKELEKMGVRVFFRQVPGEKEIEFSNLGL